ncbi:MAG: hypothetical protein ACI9ES_001144 [Oceanospirillaceae bacterium]|jgi:hypothetical protein
MLLKLIDINYSKEIQMSGHDENFKDSTGLGWLIIVTAAFLFVTMPITIGVVKYVL